MQLDSKDTVKRFLRGALAVVAVCALTGCEPDRAPRPEAAVSERLDMTQADVGLHRHTGETVLKAADGGYVDVPDGRGSAPGIPRPPDEPPAHIAPDTSVRKLIRNADLALKVASVDAAIHRLTRLAEEVGGYVTSQEQFAGTRGSVQGRAVLRVPTERLDDVLSTVADAGELLSKHIWITDVTDRYYDIEVHLNNAREEREQLRLLLGRAERLDDILRVRRELNRVTSEYERLAGQMNRLSNQIQYSTVTVSLMERLPPSHDTDRPAGKLAQAFRDMVNVFWNTVAGIIRLIGAVVPVGAFIAMLTWGAVALVRRRRR